MIDFEGYRSNVGMLIHNNQGKVFWAKRLGRNNWQFPQGGINKNESIKDAMYRELYEEVGLESKDVQLVYISCRWLKYKIPIRQCQKTSSKSRCIGQKQKWCLLKLLCNEDKINLAVSDHQEFDGWAWVSYWYPFRHIVSFKRFVYRNMMLELVKHVSIN